MAISENYINTIITFMARGAEEAHSKVEKVANAVSRMSDIDKGTLRIMGALTPQREKMLEGYRKHAEIVEQLRTKKEQVGKLTTDESKQLQSSQMQLGRYRNAITETVSAKRQFSTEFGRVQRMAQTFPKDIRYWSMQQTMLNAAVRKGTITHKEWAEKMVPVNEQIKQLEKGYGRSILAAAKYAIMWYILYRAIRTVVGGIGSAVKAHMELDDEMARVAAVTRVFGESKKEVMDMLRDAVLRYASTSIMSFKEVAEAMYHLGSAGLTVEQQLTGFSHILDLTTGTLGNVRDVSRLVAGTFNIYGDQLRDITNDSQKFKYISDLLSWTWSKQQVELSEISSAMTLCASAASLVDMPLKVLIGTIGELNTGMLRGTRSGTALMNAMIKVAQNSAKLRTEFGLVFDPEKPLDFVSIMTQLHERLGDSALSADNLRRLMGVFGIRGARAVGEILNRFNEWKKTVEVSNATFENFAKNMRREIEESLPRQLKKFANLIKSEVAPVIETAFSPLLYTLKQINKWAERRELEDYAKRLGVSIKEVEFMLEKGLIPPIEKFRKEVEKTQKAIEEPTKRQIKLTKELEEYLKKYNLEQKFSADAKKLGLSITEEEKEITEELIKLLAKKNLALAIALELGKGITEEEKKREREVTSRIIAELERERKVNEEIEKLRIRGASEAYMAHQKLVASIREQLETIKELTPEQERQLDILGITKETRGEILDLTDKESIAQQVVLDIIKGQNLVLWKIVLGEEKMKEVFQEIIKIMKKIPLEQFLGRIYDIGEAITKGWVGGTLEWARITEDIFDALGEYARETITNALTGIPAPFGGLIGGIAGGLIAGIGALIVGAGKEQEKIREATLDVSAGIDISNEQLAIVNRNLLDIRHAMEGYPMAESYYFRQRPGMGVNIQGIYVTVPEGSSSEDIVKAIEESWGVAASRVYQPS